MSGRTAEDSGDAGKRFSDVLKPAEKPERPAKHYPMRRMSLDWSPDFATVRAALTCASPEESDGADKNRNGSSK